MILIYCFNFQSSSCRLIFEKKQEKITWRMIILRCVLEFSKVLRVASSSLLHQRTPHAQKKLLITIIMMMIIIRSILLSKNPSACFHMLGKNVLKDWNATFASYCCCFPQTTQEKPLLKLKISKSHLLCCGKLGGLHCL